MRAGRLPERTGEVRADALRQLRWAMGGDGLTVDKVPLMSAVLELPGVAAALRGVPDPSAPAVALEVVRTAARSLGETVHARLLRTSLAIDYTGDAKDLTARRTEFVTAHNDAARANGGRNVLGETSRAVYDVEQRMLGALVTALGAPVGTATTAVAAGTSSGPTVEAPWVTVEQDITFRLRGRAGYEAEVLHVVRAVADGVSEFTVSYFCSERDEGGGARFRLLEGGTVEEDRTVGRPTFRTARVRYPAPLRAGETHRLRYNTLYPGSANPDPWFMLAVVRPTERATMRVSFDRAALPTRVWRADGLVVGAGGGEPDAAEPLVPDATGYVCATFEAPSPGLAYGVAWEWPANP